MDFWLSGAAAAENDRTSALSMGRTRPTREEVPRVAGPPLLMVVLHDATRRPTGRRSVLVAAEVAMLITTLVVRLNSMSCCYRAECDPLLL